MLPEYIEGKESKIQKANVLAAQHQIFSRKDSKKESGPKGRKSKLG